MMYNARTHTTRHDEIQYHQGPSVVVESVPSPHRTGCRRVPMDMYDGRACTMDIFQAGVGSSMDPLDRRSVEKIASDRHADESCEHVAGLVA